MKWLWDYKLPKNWRPKTDAEWEWYLVRKLNYDDYEGLTGEVVRKYFRAIEKYLDPGKRAMISNYLGR